VNQAVQDAIGDDGIADLLLPARDRKLGSEHGGASLIAILADLPDFATLGFIQRRHCPVVEDQNINATLGVRQPRTLYFRVVQFPA
jgi:hypothetical protein